MSDKSKKPGKLSSRETLKNYFRAGSLPKEEHFHDLIDSMLNMGDEGFSKDEKSGLKIATRGDSRMLMSFFRRSLGESAPVWRMGFDESNDSLELLHRDQDTPGGGPTLALSYDADADGASKPAGERMGRVGINTAQPERDLDVNGIARMTGRMGTVPRRQAEGDADPMKTPPPVLADGGWYNLTGKLPGCHALEVLAGVGGKKGDGQYALLHANAVCTFNPPGWFFNPFGFNFLHRKNKIAITQAYFRSRKDKIQLRWFGEQEGFTLQIRTRRNFGLDENREPIRILYHVTDLWPYPFMRDEPLVREERALREESAAPQASPDGRMVLSLD
jgi:hypothetical protein